MQPTSCRYTKDAAWLLVMSNLAPLRDKENRLEAQGVASMRMPSRCTHLDDH